MLIHQKGFEEFCKTKELQYVIVLAHSTSQDVLNHS